MIYVFRLNRDRAMEERWSESCEVNEKRATARQNSHLRIFISPARDKSWNLSWFNTIQAHEAACMEHATVSHLSTLTETGIVLRMISWTV